MLAELYMLKQSLEAAGQGISLTHRDFQTPPGLSSYKTLIAKIDDQGSITDLRLPVDGEIPGLWTLKKGNFRFFPAIRLDKPLLDLALDNPQRDSLFPKASAKSVDLTQWLAAVAELQNNSNLLLNPQDFRALVSEHGPRIAGWQSDEASSLTQLKAFIAAFDRFSTDPAVTATRLLAAAKQFCSQNPSKDFLANLAALLVGTKKEKKNKQAELEFKVQIIFDYSDPSSLSFTLHDREVHQIILRGLMGEFSAVSDKTESENRETSFCAFHSKDSRLLNTPFGGFAIKGVINKEQAPYSKKGGSAVPCNNRYHKSEDEGFPIGEDLARSLVGAMKSITSPEHENKTWRTIRNGKVEEKGGKKKETYDVLVAFTDMGSIDELSPVVPFAQKYIAREDDDGDEEEKAEQSARLEARKKLAFKQASEPVCKAFEEKLATYPGALLTLLLIRQISPGQIQLSYGNRILIRHFIHAIRRWESSEGNLPPSLKIPTIMVEDGCREFAPKLLFPEEISSLLTYQWVRDGNESTRLNAPPVGVVLDIFLNRFPDQEKAAIINLLDLLLQRSGTLFIHGGGLLHLDPRGREGRWKDFSDSSKWALLKAISMTGTLLSLLNSHAINYMKEYPYLVGFILNCADELHKQYHFANSDGKLPSTLIGNGLLSKAAESPAAAFAELLERARIYIGWAKVAQRQSIDPSLKDDKSTEGRKQKNKLFAPTHAKHALEVMEQTMDALKDEFPKVPVELDSIQKAQMFIGYLTPIPKKLKSSVTEEVDSSSVE